MIFFWIYLLAVEKPVLRLDEIYIEGNIHRPPITELEGSRLQQKINDAAVVNLKKLEERLTRPMAVEEYRTRHSKR